MMQLYFAMKHGYVDGEPGLETMVIYLLIDESTFELKHVLLGYLMNGDYCGDFELNPETFHDSKKNRDFTDVIKKWEPNTFFELPFFECNNLIPDGSDVKLPRCTPEQECVA